MKIRERMDELQQMLKGDSKASLGESASSHSLGKQKRPPSFPGKTQTGEQQMSVAPMTKKKNKKRSQSQQPTLPNIKSTSLLEDCTNEERNDVRVDSSLDTTEHRNTITSSTASTDFSEHRFRDMAKSLQRRVSKIKLKSSTGSLHIRQKSMRSRQQPTSTSSHHERQSSNAERYQKVEDECSPFSTSLRIPIPPIPSFLTMLPTTVVHRVLQFLTAKELARLAEVCLSWYPLGRNNALWFELCFERGWTRISPMQRERMHTGNGSMSVQWFRIYAGRATTERNWQLERFKCVEYGQEEVTERYEVVPEEVREEKEGPDVDTLVASADANTNMQKSHSAPVPRYKLHREVKQLPAHKSSVYCLAMTEDYIISGSKDGQVKLWSMHHHPVTRGKDNPTGISSPTILSSNLVQTLCAPRSRRDRPISVMAIATSETMVLAGLASGGIVAWNLLNGDRIFYLPHEHHDGISCMRVMNNNSTNSFQLLTSSFDGTVRYYGIRSTKMRNGQGRRRPSLLSTLDGQYEVELRCTVMADHLGVYAIDTFDVCDVDANVRFVSGGADSKVRLWNVDPFDSRQHHPVGILSGHEDTVTCVRSLGDLVVSGSMDKTVRVWSIATHSCLHTLDDHSAWVKSIAIHWEQNNTQLRVVTADCNGEVLVWSVHARGKSVHRQCKLRAASEDRPMCAEMDDYRVVVGERDGTVHAYVFEEV